MPFARAPLYIAIFLAITIAAFYPNYFSVLGAAPLAHHLHGITASLWVLLLIHQSWSIHQDHWRLHAWGGRFSFALIGPFLAGGLLVTKATVLSDERFTELFAIRLAFADIASVILVALVYFLALRNRGSVEHHSRYMLATIFPLIAPSVGRFIGFYAPGLAIRSAADLPRFGIAINIGFAVALALSLWLFLRDVRRSKPPAPFAIASIFNLLMIVSFNAFGKTALWEAWIMSFATLPSSVLVIGGVAAGVAIAWLGWTFPAGTDGGARVEAARGAAD